MSRQQISYFDNVTPPMDNSFMNATMVESLQQENIELKMQLEQLVNRLQALTDSFEQQREQQLATAAAATLSDLELEKERAELRQQNEQLKQCQLQQMQLLEERQRQLYICQQNEASYVSRIKDLEMQLLKVAETEQQERDQLGKNMRMLKEAQCKCWALLADGDKQKEQMKEQQQLLLQKDELLSQLTNKLQFCMQEAGSYRAEVELLQQQYAADNVNDNKQFSVDKITQQLEDELNYSALLDMKILKAIESDEENNLDSHLPIKYKNACKTADCQLQPTDANLYESLVNNVEALKAQLDVERNNCAESRSKLMQEKKQSQQHREQDIQIIEIMRKRLIKLLQEQEQLHQQLDKCRKENKGLQAKLKSQPIAIHMPKCQHVEQQRSAKDSTERLLNEIKILTSQLQHERACNIEKQRLTMREQCCIEQQSKSQLELIQKLKQEIHASKQDKQLQSQRCEQLQQQLTAQTQEMQQFQLLRNLQLDKEKRHLVSYERQRQESTNLLQQLQKTRMHLLAVQAECQKLAELNAELKLTVAQHAPTADIMSDKLLAKMNELNVKLAKNTEENTHMVDTMQFLIEERPQLQLQCQQLQNQCDQHSNRHELEERCQKLLERYKRTESKRKALLYQKSYLKIVLDSCRCHENAANGAFRKPLSLKVVVLAIIAIQRMKFIRNSWRSGERIMSDSVIEISHHK